MWELAIDQENENKLKENNYRDYDIIREKIKELKNYAQERRIPLTLFSYDGDNKNGALSSKYT